MKVGKTDACHRCTWSMHGLDEVIQELPMSVYTTSAVTCNHVKWLESRVNPRLFILTRSTMAMLASIPRNGSTDSAMIKRVHS
jgi:hypothetical protein